MFSSHSFPFPFILRVKNTFRESNAFELGIASHEKEEKQQQVVTTIIMCSGKVACDVRWGKNARIE
jgi:hypothetical protein